MSTTQDITSIGQLAVMLQASPDEITRVAGVLRIAPAMRINCVAYFDNHDIAAIRSGLQSPTQGKNA